MNSNNDFDKKFEDSQKENESTSSSILNPPVIFLPKFLNKEMPIGSFFVTAGVLSMVGFSVGLLIGFRKTGGIKQTLRSAPPGAVLTATKALLGGTAICAGFTTGLVYFLKSQYNVDTVKDFGDLMRGKPKEEKMVLIEEEEFLKKHSQSGYNTNINEMDEASKEALKGLKYFPFDEVNQQQQQQQQNNNNNNNDSSNNNNNNNNQN